MKKEVEGRLKFLGKAVGHGSLEFSPDGEFSVLANQGKSGYWSIEAVDKSRSPTGLAIHYSTYTKDIRFDSGIESFIRWSHKGPVNSSESFSST